MKKRTYFALAAGLVSGFVVGLVAAPMLMSDGGSAPDDWVARAGDRYISREEFITEMELRGGMRPGQYFTAEQRRALLDQLLYQAALVQRAKERGIDRQPEVRRSRDQILINQVLQQDLRPRQASADIEPEAIAAFYEEHADEYAVPARRRVAMIFLELGEMASEETRAAVVERAAEIREQALDLPPGVPDFGLLARENSDHQASRYRGGVLGWIGEGDPGRYSYPDVVIESANAMTEPGAVSGILEGEAGVYLVRLVNYEPRRTRTLEELADGIRQRLLRDRFNSVEQAFRDEVLDSAEIEIRESRFDDIDPIGPPPEEQRPEQPPNLPGSQTGGN